MLYSMRHVTSSETWQRMTAAFNLRPEYALERLVYLSPSSRMPESPFPVDSLNMTEIEDIEPLDLQAALARKLESVHFGCNKHSDQRVSFSKDLQYGLLGKYLARISLLNNEISVNESWDLELGALLPPVQWIFPYSESELLLVGSQKLSLEEAVALHGKADPSSGHESGLRPSNSLNSGATMDACSVCLQTRPYETCWECHSCKDEWLLAEGILSLCTRCLESGRWCRDNNHRLTSSKFKDKSIGWRATHAVQVVSLEEHRCQTRTVFETRSVSQSTTEPVVDQDLGVLTWILNDFHVMTLTLTTGEVTISAVPKQSQGIHSQYIPPRNEHTSSTSAVQTATTSNDRKGGSNLMASTRDAHMPTQEDHTGPLKGQSDSLCNLCQDVIRNSELLGDATLWVQRSLEVVTKSIWSVAKEIRSVGVPSSMLKYRKVAQKYLRFESGGVAMTQEDQKMVAEGTNTERMVEAPRLETLPHHPSIQSLASSILGGCILCSRLWQEMDESDKEEVRNHIRQLVRSNSDLRMNTSQVRSDIHDSIELAVDVIQLSHTIGDFVLRKKSSRAKDVELRKLSGSSRCAFGRVSNIGPEFIVPPLNRNSKHSEGPSATIYSGSEQSFSIARKWLLDCEELHHCKCSQPNEWVPTRLIDVGSVERSQPPRIYVSKQTDIGTEYLTLSHCWGKSNNFKLTRSNLERMEQSLAICEMPATFLHAVEICRGLGYRYLWIDSLCIIQDDPEDWRKEALLMAEVYRNSTCTIAALFSENVDSGCFSFRNIAGAIPVFFRTSDEILFAMPPQNEEFPEEDVDQHLNSRAWVFQERLLSPRTLGFSARGMIWNCKESSIREGHGSQDDSRSQASNQARDKEIMDQIMTCHCDSLTQEADHKHFLKFWYELVYDYSALQLTYESDKLIALAGVTQTIHQSCGFDYFYGLWTHPGHPDFFLRQLLWHTISPIGGIWYSGDPPSFSWTSRNCKVDYPITFHDRIVNNSSSGLANKSGWLKKDDEYVQLMCRHMVNLISYGKGGTPWEREIEFRTKLIALISPTSEFTVPMLLLQGPARDVTVRPTMLGPTMAWEYPWDTLPAEDKVSDDLRKRWFFPDTFKIPQTMTLLTVARWYRSWDQRWYAAGLAIVFTKVGVGFRVKEKNEIVPIGHRVGYFEHLWDSQHEHWFDDGDVRLVRVF